jgi:hypothetical protein
MIYDPTELACICCGGSDLVQSPAILMPFLANRIFGYEPFEVNSSWGMRDLKPGTAYFLCHSLQCQKCGVLFLDLRFTDTQMERLYRGYRDEDYDRLRERFEPGYILRSQYLENLGPYIKQVEEFLEPFVSKHPNILDWGGDTGANTPLKDRAKLHHVYDISNKEMAPGVKAVNLEEVNQTKYDLIVCSQVLEHIPFPRDLIEQLMSVMHGDTLLYLEVPFEKLMQEINGSKNAHLLKKHWHEHINFFTEDSLLSMCHQLGLDVIRIEHLSVELSKGKTSLISLICKKQQTI